MLNIHHIESEQGANRARNVGVEYAHSDNIMLLDDDCVPEQAWLAAAMSAFILYPEIGVFGGAMRLNFNCQRPRWMSDYFLSLLGRLDHGSGHIDFSHIAYELDATLVSGNLGFRKQSWELVGGFEEHIGQSDGQNPGGVSEIDEVLFVNRLTDPRFKPPKMYFGNMIIWHQIDESRANIDYLIRKAYSHGAGLATMCLNSPRIADDYIEDIIVDLLPTQWQALFTMNDFVRVRAEICHEESFRIYFKNLILCRNQFFRGFMDVLLQSDRKSYEQDLGKLFFIGPNFYDQFAK
jgi:glycosyltransferase involved in cell wall biosynthesis